MSVVIRCDGGCGKTTTNLSAFKTLGYVRNKHYCEECAVTVDSYREGVDLLHDGHVKAFTESMEELRSEWLASHPQGQLPDTMPPSQMPEEVA